MPAYASWLTLQFRDDDDEARFQEALRAHFAAHYETPACYLHILTALSEAALYHARHHNPPASSISNTLSCSLHLLLALAGSSRACRRHRNAFACISFVACGAAAVLQRCLTPLSGTFSGKVTTVQLLWASGEWTVLPAPICDCSN